MSVKDDVNMNSGKRQINEGAAWRSPWVWGMLGLVAVMVSVNLVMITIGIKTHPGLVVDDFYERGKNYFNSEVKRVNDIERLGWQFDLAVPETPVLNATQTYQLNMTDADGYPLKNADVVFEAFRPSDASKDFQVQMVEGENGRYSAQIEFAQPGVWDLLVTANKGEDRMDHAKRLFVKG